MWQLCLLGHRIANRLEFFSKTVCQTTFSSLRMKYPKIIIYSSAVLLFVTAVAKIISGFGSSRILERNDPLFQLSYRNLFLIAGILELGVAGYCILGRHIVMRIGVVAWISTVIFVYRIGVMWVGYQKSCPCLGTLTGALRISPQTADTAMQITLAYLLLGSYATLLWLWRQYPKAERGMQNATGGQ